MSDLHALYQELILDHSRSPRNFGVLAGANHEAKGYNPLCGDKVQVYLHMEDNRIKDIHFEGQGCAISMASASLMTEMVKGKTESEAKELFTAFHDMVTGKTTTVPLDEILLDKLMVMSGVQQFPVRVKCATLPWHTMEAAIKNKKEQVTTELATELTLQKPTRKTLENKAIAALQTVFDPEIPVNIWELGLVYKLDISENQDVLVQMTLTAPNCPVADTLPIEVEEKLLAIPDIGDVRVQLVWDPPWTPDRMSEAAKLELGFL